MPPQSLLSVVLRALPLSSGRGLRAALIVSLATLAGCATTSGSDVAYADGWAARDPYLSSTQSDPLGAYLRSRQYRSEGSLGFNPNPALASTALSALGIKYSFGGDTPSTGFDCSGLVIYAAEKSLGLKLPRQSREIAQQGISVKRNELRKGDLVFFNTLGHRYSHVGIYLGDSKFVHAPRAGSVVRIEDMDIGYWKKRYNGARRLVATAEQASQ